MAQRREQVGAERRVRAPAGPQHVQHPGERLGHQFVGIGRGPRHLAGQVARGGDVPFVQRAVGGEMPGAYRFGQLGIAGFTHVLGHCGHIPPPHRQRHRQVCRTTATGVITDG